MSNKSICYHTRAANDNTIRITGGTFGMSTVIEGRLDATVERLAKRFTVGFTSSGRPVFVDSEGRQVSLYISVHPELTEVGQAAIRARRIEDDAKRAAAALRVKAEADELEDLMSGLTHAEIIKRLKGQ